MPGGEPLPYRSLRFEHRHLAQSLDFQPVTTVITPMKAYTRITEVQAPDRAGTRRHQHRLRVSLCLQA